MISKLVFHIETCSRARLLNGFSGDKSTNSNIANSWVFPFPNILNYRVSGITGNWLIAIRFIFNPAGEI